MAQIPLSYLDDELKGKLKMIIEVKDKDIDYVARKLTCRCRSTFGECPVGTINCPFYPIDNCGDVTKLDWKKVFTKGVDNGKI